MPETLKVGTTTLFIYFYFVKKSHFNLPSSQWTGNREESLQTMRDFRPCTTSCFFFSLSSEGKAVQRQSVGAGAAGSVTGGSGRKGIGFRWVAPQAPHSKHYNAEPSISLCSLPESMANGTTLYLAIWQ